MISATHFEDVSGHIFSNIIPPDLPFDEWQGVQHESLLYQGILHPPPPPTPSTSLTQQLTILKNKQRWNSFLSPQQVPWAYIEGFGQIQWWRKCYVCNIRMAKNSFKGNKFEHQCVWHIKEVSARHDQNCNSIEVGQTFQKPKNLFFWKILKIDIFSEIRYESQLGLVA